MTSRSGDHPPPSEAEGGGTRGSPSDDAWYPASCETAATGDRPMLKITYSLPSCPADFNGEGFLDFFDYDAFVAAHETGC